jgi:hypothetical protein
MASLRAAVLDAAEPAPRFLAELEAPPDFASESLTKAAARFADEVSAKDLRAAIASYMNEYKDGLLGRVVRRGLELYLFAYKFRKCDGTVAMPISRKPSDCYAYIPNINFGCEWHSDSLYDRSSNFLPIWNDAREAAKAMLRLDAVMADDATARLLLAALAMLYANDRVPAQHKMKVLAQGTFLKHFEREIAAADLSVLGVAAFDLMAGHKIIDESHKLQHWNDAKPFFKYCGESGLFRSLVAAPKALAPPLVAAPLAPPLVAAPLAPPLAPPLATPLAALLAGPTGELSTDQSHASQSKRGQKRSLEEPPRAGAEEVQGQLDELNDRMDTVCMLAKTDAACNGDASGAKKAVEALHAVGAHARISSLVKWSVALEEYSPRCETRFSAVVREIRDELYHLIGARDMAPRGGQVKAWDLAERIDELRDCMDAVCRLSKSGKACDVDVPIAEKAIDSLFEVGLYARASSLKKWSVALDVYPPRHGDHPAFSAKIYEMKAELYQLLLSRETARLVG